MVRLAQLGLEAKVPAPVSTPLETGCKAAVEGGRARRKLVARKLGLILCKVEEATVVLLGCCNNLIELRKLKSALLHEVEKTAVLCLPVPSAAIK